MSSENLKSIDTRICPVCGGKMQPMWAKSHQFGIPNPDNRRVDRYCLPHIFKGGYYTSESSGLRLFFCEDCGIVKVNRIKDD